MASTPDNSAYALIAEAASNIAASAKVLAVQVKLLQRDNVKKNQARTKTSSSSSKTKTKTATAVASDASDSSDASEAVPGVDAQEAALTV